MKYFQQIFGHSRWSASAAVYSILIQALLYLIITRYISVEDIGLYALASSFVFIGVTILDSSFNSSIIHTDNPKELDYQSVWALNTRLTGLLILVLMVLVSLFEWVSDKSNLFLPAFSMLPLLFLSAFNGLHFTGLKKNMLFRTLGVIDIISTTFQFVAILVMAFLDFGLWSLVTGVYIKYIVSGIIIVATKNTYCSISLSLHQNAWHKHYSYGKYIISEKGLSSLLSYTDIFLIGHFLGFQQLGIYDILKKMVMRPIIILYASIEQIVFPLLSGAKYESDNYNKVYKEFSRFILILFFPVLLLIYTNGYYVLQLFPEPYSEQTLLLGSIVLWACTTLFINPIDIILYSVGKTRLFFKWYLATYIFQLGLMWYTIQIGLDVFIKAISFFNIIIWLLSYHLIIKSNTFLKIKAYFEIGILSLPILILLVSFYPIVQPSYLSLICANMVIFIFIGYHIAKIRLKDV